MMTQVNSKSASSGPRSFLGLISLTSGGHEYVEESRHWAKVWLMTGADGYPAGMEGEMMAFEDVWSDSKMLIFVKRMRELALAERASKPAEAIGKDCTTWLGWEGESHDLAPRTAMDGLKKRLWPGKRPGPPPLDAPAGLPAKVPEAPRPPPIESPPISPEIPRDNDLSAGPGFTWFVCKVFGDPGPHPVNLGVTADLPAGSKVALFCLLPQDASRGRAVLCPWSSGQDPFDRSFGDRRCWRRRQGR